MASLRSTSMRAVARACRVAALLAIVSRGAAAESVLPRFWGTDGTVHALAVSEDAVYLGGVFTTVLPMTGGGVPLDERTGQPVPDFPIVNGSVYAAVPDGAGGWYIGGSFTDVAGVPRDNLAHVLADGGLADWNPGVHDNYGGSNAYVFALALKDATLYLGGFFLRVGQTRRVDLAAVDVNTGAVRDWNPAPSGYVAALRVVGNTLYAGGPFYNIGGVHRAFLAAFDASTGALSGWNPGANDAVRAFAASGDILYAGGEFTTIGGVPRSRLAALDAASGAVLPWDPAPDGDVYAIEAAQDVVFVGGDFDSLGGQPRARLGSVRASDGVATPWATSEPFAGVRGLALDGDVLLACGGGAVAALRAEDGATRWRRRLRGDGAVVAAGESSVGPAHRPPARGRPDRTRRDGGIVYVGGAFQSIGDGIPRAGLAAFDLGTGAATDWNPGANGPVNALAIEGRRVWIGGQFTTIGGEPRVGLAAVDPQTGWHASEGLDVDGSVLGLAVDHGVVYVAGGFSRLGGAERSNLAAVDARTEAVTSWNPGTNGPVSGFAVGAGVVYAGGAFTLAGGGGAGPSPRSHVAAFDAASGALLPWAPEADGTVDVLLLDGDRIGLGGAFSHLGGQLRPGLGAVDGITGVLDPWSPWLSNYNNHPSVRSLARTGTAVYVGGAFQFLGGDWRYHFGAVDPVTAALTGWDPKLLGTPLSLTIREGTLFVGGAFDRVGGFPCANFAAIRLEPVTSPALEHAGAPDRRGGGLLSLACAPNPSRDATVIRFTLPVTARATLAIYDLAGRRVAQVLNDGAVSAGAHDARLETGGWKPGLYLCRLEAGGLTRVTKLLVTR